MAKDNTAEKVLEIARSQIGVTSGDKYVDYYNEITGSHLPRGCAWCACFVTWVMRHAGVPTDSVLNYKGCATGALWFAERGRYMTKVNNPGYIPKPGDVIFYEWYTPQDGEDHTGIVERVENGRVYTIEGNNGGKCQRDWWSIWPETGEVAGYGVPLYNIEEEPDMTYEEWKKFQKQYEKELSEMPAAKWAVPAIDYCKKNGIMDGDADGQFRPYSHITRQEVAQVMMNADNRLRGAVK